MAEKRQVVPPIPVGIPINGGRSYSGRTGQNGSGTLPVEGPITLQHVERAYGMSAWGRARTTENWAWRQRETDEYRFWDKLLEIGRSYMVGSDVPMEHFIRTHSSPLTLWQKVAYDFAIEHPDLKLIIDTGPKCWHVYLRGEYVDFGLPHHDAGGEHNWQSRDGKTKIRTNDD